MPVAISPQWGRPLVHAGALIAILLLPWLTPAQALLFLVAAFLGNFLLPFLLPWVLPKERLGLGHLETVHYPLALAVTFVAFGALPNQATPLPWSAEGWRMWIAHFQETGTLFYSIQTWPILAWLTLALGDPLLGLSQRTFRLGPPLPWNAHKRWIPWLIALAICLPLLTWLCTRLLPIPWGLAALAIALGLVAETIWIQVDDNWLIPFTVCMVGAMAIHLPLYLPLHTQQAPSLAIHLAGWLCPILFGIGAWTFRKLTPAGACLGAALGFMLWQGHPYLFLGLCWFFVLGVGATRYGMKRKSQFGIAEPRDGKRGAAEVFGAMGIATWCATLPITYRYLGADAKDLGAAFLVPLAAMTTKTMDTVSSEIGKALRGKTFTPPLFRPAQPGEEGGMSLQGTLAGLVGSVFFLFPFLGLHWVDAKNLTLLVLIAFVANLGESLWARFWQSKGRDPGVQTNVALCAFSVVFAWWIFIIMPGG
jgi:uncharacterized protein (TIGR00297 family)